MFSKKNIYLWGPVFLWAFVIFAFSSMPTTSVSEIHWGDFVVKKTAHLVEYAVLSTLIYRALLNSGTEKRKAGYTAIVSCFLYGLSDEFHQSFTPGRGPAFRDVIIDTIGASIAIYFLWNIAHKLPFKLRNWLVKLQVIS